MFMNDNNAYLKVMDCPEDNLFVTKPSLSSSIQTEMKKARNMLDYEWIISLVYQGFQCYFYCQEYSRSHTEIKFKSICNILIYDYIKFHSNI